jgi:4-alpha-glucanotransferase
MNEDSALHGLAAAAGIEIDWQDANGNDKVVADSTLRAVLGAIGFPAGTESDIAESRALLAREGGVAALPLTTAALGQPVTLAGKAGRFRLVLESGAVFEGVAWENAGGVQLPAIQEEGYHRLEFNDAETVIAVTAPCAHTLHDAGGGEKLWGLALQLYALRRAGDWGIGDFAALEDFVARAAGHGADAVAISPVHAQFSADVSRFGPYAPSNRAALNVMHIAQDAPGLRHDDGLVDWPAASAGKLQALRSAFATFHDHDALHRFRAAGGAGLERHVIFEALSVTLSEHNSAALDWRNWPAAYQNPENPAVIRFAEDHAHEVSFHAWLQYLADAGLEKAQAAAKTYGMKIGLIADLAVGTDHAGSHSWSRQQEVLRGLEIGAPPDLVNREGQSWGITAFSPRGLRNSGFSAFIDMLRHALRHAGGVRIDHVMGLARLWVVPQGMSSTEGAYLKMPARDLMRLVVLESRRHRAVILGEDLGTLPYGFDQVLSGAGIAGLRVMWFERNGIRFNAPADWTRMAVAMTSTHDLPTVAGWWQGNDIQWRNRIGMAGDDEVIREVERRELWTEMQASGATQAPQPPAEDGAAATYAACAHLGRAGSLLALLPVEDLISSPEQPNLPGTTDQHPNWRRRLPVDNAGLFAREDVVARLAVLNAARRA